MLALFVHVLLGCCLVGPVCGLRIFHVFLNDDKNIGDVYSSPLRWARECQWPLLTSLFTICITQCSLYLYVGTCCAAVSYFPDLANVITKSICVDANTPEVIAACADLSKEDITIIGGGGLLDHSDRWNFALKYYCQITTCKTCVLWSLVTCCVFSNVAVIPPLRHIAVNNITFSMRIPWCYLCLCTITCYVYCHVYCYMSCLGVLWSPGRNRHHTHLHKAFTHTTEQILTLAAAGRTRDFSHPDEPAPLLDPSCLLPGMQISSSPSPSSSSSSCEKTRGVGFYLHAKLAQLKRTEMEQLLVGVDPQDVLFNNELNITTVLQFLCTHEVIVTSSYHGVLWATYMNIPVYTVFDFSEKFANLPFAVRKYPISDENNKNISLSRTLYVNGELVKDQCIENNRAFYSMYIEPFVTVLKTLAFTPQPLVITRRSSSISARQGARESESESESEWLRITDFNLRDVVSTVRAECAPLNRNHVYDKLNVPKYEANLFLELDARYHTTHYTTLHAC